MTKIILSKEIEIHYYKEVKNQDSVRVISLVSVAMTKNGRDKAWEFFKQNKEEITNRYEAGFMLSKLVKV